MAADAHVLPEVDQPLLRWGDTLLLLELLLDFLCLSSMHGRKDQYRLGASLPGAAGEGLEEAEGTRLGNAQCGSARRPSRSVKHVRFKDRKKEPV